jgi:hypothetical protein
VVLATRKRIKKGQYMKRKIEDDPKPRKRSNVERVLPSEIWSIVLDSVAELRDVLACRAVSVEWRRTTETRHEVWEELHKRHLGPMAWPARRARDNSTETWFSSFLLFSKAVKVRDCKSKFYETEKEEGDGDPDEDYDTPDARLSGFAAVHGLLPVVEKLVSEGRYSPRSENIASHLQIAIQKGWTELSCFLIKKKLYKDNDEEDDDITAARRYPTALHSAVDANDYKVAKLLLKEGAEPDHEVDADADCVSKAAAHGNPKLVQLLLDYGGPVRGHDWLTWGPLHCTSDKATLEVLLDHLEEEGDEGATLNEEVTWTIKRTPIEGESKKKKEVERRCTKIMVEAMKGHADIVKFLLERGAKKGLKKAYLMAKENGHQEIVDLLAEVVGHPQPSDVSWGDVERIVHYWY